MKQSAVEWLLWELSKVGYLPNGIPENIHKQAKEMEKQQTCSFGAKCCLMTRQQRSWNIEDLYDENF